MASSVAGSGLFSKARPKNPGSVDPGKGGIAGEVGELRADLQRALFPLAAIAVEEYTNALATSTTNVMAASATLAAGVVLTSTPVAGGGTNALTKATTDNLAAAPRQLTFTTAGSTPANAPATATIYGTDERGYKTSETVPLSQIAGAVTSGNFFLGVDRIVYSASKGTGATIAIGLGASIGLSRPLKKRAGAYAVIREVSSGTVVTTGTFKNPSDNTVASAVGTVNLVDSVPTMPTTQTLVVTIDGVQYSITFNNPANLAAIVTQINTAVGKTVASAGGASNKYLVLSSILTGAAGSVLIVSGTTTILTVLGFTASALVRGTSYGKNGSYTPAASLDGAADFAVYYEFDASAIT